MSADYLDQLDPASLGLLAETTGMASRVDAGRFFSERPNGIRVALGAPEAVALLTAETPVEGAAQHRLLQIAIAVHHTAQEICSSGWTARDESPVDLPLLRFAGQGPYQAFMIDLLSSYLPADWSLPEFFETPASPAGSIPRLYELIDLCGAVAETERAGALRLLGDEALFTVSMYPAAAAASPITPELLAELEAVLPKAVRSLLEDLRPSINSLLDVYLTFGPVWYRMASQNLLHRTMRESLSDMAREFSSARRFLVRVAQGPLASLRQDLFAVPC